MGIFDPDQLKSDSADAVFASAAGDQVFALSADRPIEDRDQDALYRREVVDAIAADVRRAPTATGFVIGLTGPWGSGKTSVLNLVADQLLAEKRTIIRFNPWLFSGTEQLVGHFFAELTGQLEATGEQRLKRVAKALRGYGRVVAPLRYLPHVGGLFGFSSKIAGDLSEALGGSEEASAELQAAKLRRQLAGLERPIVVLVDDLDRLRPEEIVDVIRLVRLVGDFPNLLYLVAYDRREVEEALGGEGGRERGNAYLGKVINLAHELPPIRRQDLNRILQQALEAAVPEPSRFRIDTRRMDNLFWANAAPLFETVRDIRRYTNAIAATLDLIGDEVDLADVLTLEALRLFEPEAFKAMVDARYALTGTHPPRGRIDFAALFGRDEAANKELVTRIPTCAIRDPAGVERIVRQLFPRSEVHFGGSAIGGEGYRDAWLAHRLVAAGDPFETYLQRRIPPGEIPAREVEQVASVLTDAERLRSLLDRLDQEQLSNLYTRLADISEAFPADRRIAIQAVLDHPVGFADSFRDMSGAMLVHQLLRGLPSPEILDILEELRYPNLSIRLATIRNAGKARSDANPTLEPLDAERLERHLVDDVLASDPNDLADEVDLAALLRLAAGHDPSRLHSRLGELAENQRFFVELLAGHKMEKRSDYGRLIQLNWFGFTDLLGEDRARELLKAIDANWVRNGFTPETWELWQQALRYAEDASQARRDLAGWSTGTGRGPLQTDDGPISKGEIV